MQQEHGPRRSHFRHDLAFVGTVAFVASFFGARLFVTLFPGIVLIQQGIHFHHFWYGIAMISAAGWLGIAARDNRFDRVFALIFGLGAGFIGDEVGLLLTLGNYESELTFQFFIGAVAFAIIAILLLEYGDDLEREVLHLAWKERLSLLGVFTAGFSAIFFAFGQTLPGALVAFVGVASFLIGSEVRKKPNREHIR